RTMVSERQPVRHPAVACAQIRNIERLRMLTLDHSQNVALEISIARTADRPLPGILPSHVAIRQFQVVARIVRAAPFSVPDLAVVIEELSPDGLLHVTSARRSAAGDRRTCRVIAIQCRAIAAAQTRAGTQRRSHGLSDRTRARRSTKKP